MKRIAMWTLAACIPALAFTGEPATEPGLSVAQIVEKNVVARGGAEAWRKIQTMVWQGHVESANSAVPTLPFALEMKRPNKTRFQITALNQMAVRVFDGTQGWKLRPAHSGKLDLQPYTPEEVKFAQEEQVIDGPLIDHEQKGVAVSLDGVDDVEGRKSYRLNVRLPSGVSHHMWIDAQTFLDIKYDRETRNPKGQPVTVSVFYRNYQSVEGLQIPLLIETGVGATPRTNKLVIEKVALNPPLDDWRFAKPDAPGHSTSVSIGPETPQAARDTHRPGR
ncbi:hypothetical protein [Paraherbaspirillum soli]|uniref:Outer membrane lipoprotein-sorting protein n=1 Tax=Paraherbaspirillum soli TaxID=631222 RepID=A0ABW0MD41_9BURK